VSCLKITSSYPPIFKPLPDDSAAHVSEEVVNSARAAPLAILIGVAGTAGLGWILLIAASFATASVPDLLDTTLPLAMGQLFLDTLGKRGMLTIWSFIIVVQVCDRFFI
jgi:amino acid transporter